jgi:hypothetical protein
LVPATKSRAIARLYLLPIVEAATVLNTTYAVDRRPSRPRPEATVRTCGRRPTYTAEQILDAIRRWTDQYGAPPARADWEPSRARRMGHDWRVTRFLAGEWPTTRMVCRCFGTLNAAVEAAGFRPNRAPGRIRTHLSGPDAVLDAIREWVRRYGDVPTLADWDPVRARRLGHEWRAVRYRQGDWPSLRTVAHHFGSLNNATRLANLQPRSADQRTVEVRAGASANRAELMRGDSQTRCEPGIEDLARALRGLAAARRREDPEATRMALLDVAAGALAWADVPVG